MLSSQVVQLNLHLTYPSTARETSSAITETSISHPSEPHDPCRERRAPGVQDYSFQHRINLTSQFKSFFLQELLLQPMFKVSIFLHHLFETHSDSVMSFFIMKLELS